MTGYEKYSEWVINFNSDATESNGFDEDEKLIDLLTLERKKLDSVNLF